MRMQKKRILSGVCALAMVAVLLPSAVWAEGSTPETASTQQEFAVEQQATPEEAQSGADQVPAEDEAETGGPSGMMRMAGRASTFALYSTGDTFIDIADGTVVIGDGTYIQGTNEPQEIPAEGLVITGSSEQNRVIVDPGEGKTAAFTISDLSLASSAENSLIDVQSGSAVMNLAGQNTLTNDGAQSLYSALVHVADAQALSIAGDGSLTLINGTQNAAAHGAALGGSAGESGGAIRIESGIIDIAQYGPGAGIGGGGPAKGSVSTGDSGAITIAGGTVSVSVQAVDNYGGGCGIGPGLNYGTVPYVGNEGIANSILISGGSVKSETKISGGYYSGAAIGTGRIGAAQEDSLIHITGTANVKATMYGPSAAIGASAVNAGLGGVLPEGKSKILIDGNSSVEAQTIYANSGLYAGAAIGMGANGFVSPWEIEISGNAIVNATGGEVGAGIGSAIASYRSQSELSITIGGSAKVTAIGKDYAAGIGTSLSMADSSSMTEITIKDQAVVNATGGYGAAAIGAGSGFITNNSGNITITGNADVTATGGINASAIGAGDTGKVAGTTTITAGTQVVAYADGKKFAIDTDVTSSGKVDVPDTVLNGRFAKGEVTPVNSGETDTESPINLLKDGNVDAELVLPVDYRAFAVTASDGTGAIQVQNGSNLNLYAYYIDETNTKQLKYPLYNTPVTMFTKDELKWMPMVELQPADITIYMGGDGYTGVVDETGASVGNTNGLPEPGFYVTLPEDLNNQLKAALGKPEDQPLDLSPYLYFASGDKRWTLELYDKAQTSIVNGKYIYRLVAADGQDAVRMRFTDQNGTVKTSDQFELADALYSRYSMEIYPGAVQQNTVYAEIDLASVAQAGGKTDELQYTSYAAKALEGELTIRGVTQAGKTTPVAERVTSAVQQITAVAPADTVYTINASKVQLVNGNPSLLVDEIVSSAGSEEYRSMLADRAVRMINTSFQNVQYQAKYLDLVDASNGNVWLTPSKPVTVYWPYPEGTDKNTQFYLVHFEGLDREITSADISGEIERANMQQVEVTCTAYGISFAADSFSPYVLLWDKPAEKPVEQPKPSADTGTDEEPAAPVVTPAPTATPAPAATPAPTAAAPAVIPQTGDAMPIELLVGVVIVAALAFVGLLILRKRRGK